MHIDDLMAYLDSLVGKEGREVSDEYIEPEDVLTFEYSSGEFGSLALLGNSEGVHINAFKSIFTKIS